MSGSETPLWAPTPERQSRANVTRFLDWVAAARGHALRDYHELWRWSVEDLDGFWDCVWRFYDVAPRDPGAPALSDRRMPGARWFPNTELNYAEQVLERAPAEEPAIVHLSEDGAPVAISTEELRGKVGALATTLRELGVGPGDRVAGYLPNIPEAVIALLAVASLGAVWAACAPDFGTASVIDRFAQIEPVVLLAIDGYRWGGRAHDRRATIAELQAALPSLGATIIVQSLDPGARIREGSLTFDEACRTPCEPTFQPVPFDHPLWILFSSGTTGLPKGIVHGHGGIVVEHLKSLGLCLDLRAGDRYFFFSSTSWMAWNYLVGGLLHGATIVLYNGSPAHPSADALWGIAAATRTTVLGMGSAYVAGCEKARVELTGHELAPLRTVIPTGSPLAPGGWDWLARQLNPLTRIDSICGGTDVCTAFFGGSELLPVYSGEISCRWLGVDARACDAAGREVVDEVGEFVVGQPMPSMPISLWDDPDGRRYRAAYFEMFPGTWRQGDWIAISSSGTVRVLGRSDATLNRGGVRIGSAEIYSAVERLPEIADSLVVGVEMPDGEYYMPLFVVPSADGASNLERLVEAEIRARLSPRHVPDEVVVVPAVPRTLTGKKLEVPVKRILQGVAPEMAAATGSVDRPDVLAWFAEFAARRNARLVGTGD